jgi:hypothetical protein
MTTSSSPKPAKPEAIPKLDQAQIEALRVRREARLASFIWLRGAYPLAFGAEPKPLAVGVGRSIVEAALASGRWPSKQRAYRAATDAVRRYVGSLG